MFFRPADPVHQRFRSVHGPLPTHFPDPPDHLIFPIGSFRQRRTARSRLRSLKLRASERSRSTTASSSAGRSLKSSASRSHLPDTDRKPIAMERRTRRPQRLARKAVAGEHLYLYPARDHARKRVQAPEGDRLKALPGRCCSRQLPHSRPAPSCLGPPRTPTGGTACTRAPSCSCER
jgi:hypothetical protein